MGQSIAKLVQTYIRDNDSIRSCLERDLINHAALARKISTAYGLENKEEAMCIALRRYVQRRGRRIKRSPELVKILRNLPAEVTFNTDSNHLDQFCVRFSFHEWAADATRLASAMLALLEYDQIPVNQVRFLENQLSIQCSRTQLAEVLDSLQLSRSTGASSTLASPLAPPSDSQKLECLREPSSKPAAEPALIPQSDSSQQSNKPYSGEL